VSIILLLLLCMTVLLTLLALVVVGLVLRMARKPEGPPRRLPDRPLPPPPGEIDDRITARP